MNPYIFERNKRAFHTKNYNETSKNRKEKVFSKVLAKNFYFYTAVTCRKAAGRAFHGSGIRLHSKKHLPYGMHFFERLAPPFQSLTG